jgi:hypothetical protein
MDPKDLGNTQPILPLTAVTHMLKQLGNGFYVQLFVKRFPVARAVPSATTEPTANELVENAASERTASPCQPAIPTPTSPANAKPRPSSSESRPSTGNDL